MNGANHRLNGGEKVTLKREDLPLKDDTVIGNDVWIGENVTILPGTHIVKKRFDEETFSENLEALTRGRTDLLDQRIPSESKD